MADFGYISWFDPTIGWLKSRKSSLVGKRNVFSPICFFSADDCWRPMQLGVHLGWSYLRLDHLRLWFASDGRLASRFTWGTSSCRWWCLGWIEAGRGWRAWGELSRKRLKSGLVCVFFFWGGGQGWRLNKVGLEKQRRCSRHLFDLFLFTNSTGYIICIYIYHSKSVSPGI